MKLSRLSFIISVYWISHYLKIPLLNKPAWPIQPFWYSWQVWQDIIVIATAYTMLRIQCVTNNSLADVWFHIAQDDYQCRQCWLLCVPGRQCGEETCAWCSAQCTQSRTPSAPRDCVMTWTVVQGSPVEALQPVALSHRHWQSHFISSQFQLSSLPAFTSTVLHRFTTTHSFVDFSDHLSWLPVTSAQQHPWHVSSLCKFLCSICDSSVSYTHLTLPTKRIV